MARRKKHDFDAAALNKQDYIKSNYSVKEEVPQNTLSKNNKMIIISMLSFLFLSVALLFYWNYFIKPQNQQNAQQIQAEITSAVVETTPSATPRSIFANSVTPTPRPILSKYLEYDDLYPDIVGWISIDNIKVDYPVVQSPDPTNPFKYLDLGADEQPSNKGAIFLDIRNSIDATDRHTIIYGHNMRDGSMFGQLDKYLTRSFFFNHLIIKYDTLYEELEWEVFNVFMTTTEFYYIQTYFPSDEEFVNLMTQCVYKSYYNDNSTVIKPKDRILTLSTCTNEYEDGRLVIQARLITPLEGDETENKTSSSEESEPNT